jgi:hypothetical protein
MRFTATFAAVIAIIVWCLGLVLGFQASLVAFRIGRLPCCVDRAIPNPAAGIAYIAVPIFGLAGSLILLWLAWRSQRRLATLAGAILWLIFGAAYAIIAGLSVPVPV